jgi:hypothetical protein
MLNDDERNKVWQSTMKAFNLPTSEHGNVLKYVLKKEYWTLSVREIRDAVQTATKLATKENRPANVSDIGMVIDMIQGNRRLY